MKAALRLLLPCLLAKVWLVPGLAPSSWSPGAQAGPETSQPPTDQYETFQGVQAPEEEQEKEPWLTASEHQLCEDTFNLGFSLLRKICMKHEGNVVFSPLGLSSAMAALTLGAKGQTKAQLESGLLQTWNRTGPGHLPTLFRQLRERLSHNRELGLIQGSLAFIHEDFDIKETFLNLSKRYFDTECVTMNFRNASQAQGLMNHYINKQTQGKIPKLFAEINPDTKLILVDYILLKGRWLTPFDPVFTEADTFRLNKYKAVKVPMMYRAGNFASTFDKNFRCHVLKLPYQGNATMLVVLMEKIGDHLALEDYLTSDLVDSWLRNMNTRNMEVFFPKFKLDQKYEMHELLKQMGIRKIFSPWASLSELSATARNLKVTKVLQKSVIEVNEKGTEAMAGTLSEIIAYSMPSIIKVDRPFHFMIYEETSRMLLFLGRVVNPTLL
ncbi:protein Z-dependent protease inhibitor [Desmodus rotundus]|uniref:protein Z-dependent protease inhibitor n=1 Tax=Desmodus rotundus TaxID=9430 RepID=UPI002380E2E5|nr:protein Z-dependent protease inhibitor [Desmodus rotundus]XP_045057458.2 protein Z-dependent protease inhibitor [Desmodus rotundus]XP_045057459.2 protein Z-dependent protease inhibitor [Desmodus rotundus]XP_045057460.2 protein Z-dependent protease inhibitor [Desmodus rotundus]